MLTTEVVHNFAARAFLPRLVVLFFLVVDQLTCRDLVSTVNSREFVAQQLGGMTAAIGDARFAQLMATVDPVIVGQLQPFLN